MSRRQRNYERNKDDRKLIEQDREYSDLIHANVKSSPNLLRWSGLKEDELNINILKEIYEKLDNDIIKALADINPLFLKLHMDEVSEGVRYNHCGNVLADTFNWKLDGVRWEKYQNSEIPWSRHLHWGQMKLLLVEIKFLIHVMKMKKSAKHVMVVYAGAAQGHHIGCLSGLFPEVYFHLYDKGPWAVKESNRIKIFNEYVSEGILRERYADSNYYMVLISDIRVDKDEKQIQNDMGEQLKWWKIGIWEWSMFKFRLPYIKDPGDETKTTVYPEGEIWIQPFPPKSSAETRLIVAKGANDKIYSNYEYEGKCYYHNKYERSLKYARDDGLEFNVYEDGFCNCYDCTWMYYCCEEYAKWRGWKIETELVIGLMNKLISEARGANISIKKLTTINFEGLIEILRFTEKHGRLPKTRDVDEG
jgi:hypothetical protein